MTMSASVPDASASPAAGAERREHTGGILGTAVGLRPELGGFAALTVIQLGRTRGRAALTEALCLGAFLLPACAPALVRLIAFGTPLPLAFVAKEPEASSGLRYLLGGLVFCGPLWLLWLLPFAEQARDRRWASVAAAHALCVGLAGGDWMPLQRFTVHVLPLVFLLVEAGLVRMAAAWTKAVRLTDKKEFNPLEGFAVR